MFVSLFCSCDQMSLIEVSYYASNQYPIISDSLWCLVWRNDKWWVALYYFRHKMCEKCTEMAKMTPSAKKFSPFWEDWRLWFLKCEESEDIIFGKVKKWRLKNEDQRKVWTLSVKIVFSNSKIPKSTLAG